MIGASMLMARANGLKAKTFMNKLVDMSINNQITFGLGVGAIALGKNHPSGSYFADPLTAHTNKVMVATLPYEVKRLTQDIGGGIVEIGCMPSYADVSHPEYGPFLQKCLKAGGCSAESLFKAEASFRVVDHRGRGSGLHARRRFAGWCQADGAF